MPCGPSLLTDWTNSPEPTALFGDPKMTTMLLNRLTHHWHILGTMHDFIYIRDGYIIEP